MNLKLLHECGYRKGFLLHADNLPGFNVDKSRGVELYTSSVNFLSVYHSRGCKLEVRVQSSFFFVPFLCFTSYLSLAIANNIHMVTSNE